jgi:microbial collagenase
LGVENGGLYYEDLGTLYTFDRPATPGNYTLEELTRHEYSHYVIERFLVAGLWGKTPLYSDNRMVWFDEGFAEFLTGSTAVAGVQSRLHLANLLAGDGPTGRMSLAQVFASVYGDFKFYRYAAFFFNYMYLYRRDLLRQFIELVRNGDAMGFDMLRTQLASDSALEAAYQTYLDGVIAGIATLSDPTTNFPAISALDSNDVAQIQAAVRSTRIGYLAEASVSAKHQDTRFTCRGVLTTQPGAADIDAAWVAFNADLDELLRDLRTKPLNNFQQSVARFGQIRFEATGSQYYALADYYVEGPLGPENSVPLSPPDQVQMDFASTRLGTHAACHYDQAKGVVTCTLSIPTQLFPLSTPDGVLDQQLTDDLDELRNQVYAIRPPYFYRNFTCAWAGTAKPITTGSDKYKVRPIIATVAL